MKRGRKKGQPAAYTFVGNIAGMRMKSGKTKRSSLFWDRNGNPVSNAEVYREVDDAVREFWAKRGKSVQQVAQKPQLARNPSP